MSEKSVNINRWVHKANEDLAAAKQLMVVNSRYYASTIIFHLQQAAEKYIYALCLHQNAKVPEHALIQDMVRLLPNFKHDKQQVELLEQLDTYDLLIRYPSDVKIPDEHEIYRYKDIVESLKITVEKDLGVSAKLEEPEYNTNETYLLLKDYIAGDPELYTYLHNTDSLKNVHSILKQGFRFKGYLEYTAESISGMDSVELRYFMHKRQSYGRYTIVLQISREMLDLYSAQIRGTHHNYAEIFSISKELDDEENEVIFLLPVIFIKGYFDHVSKQSYLSEFFNPYKELDVFKENLKEIMAERKNK